MTSTLKQATSIELPSGEAFVVKQGGSNRIQVSAAGQVDIIGANNQNINITTSGTGTINTTPALGGVSNFLALSDTPDAYTSQQDKIVNVNAAANALEFRGLRLGTYGSTACIAIGNSSTTVGASAAVAIGSSSTASNAGVAIGQNSVAGGVAIGPSASAASINAIAIGNTTTAGNITIGSNSESNLTGGISLGNNITNNPSNTIIIGNDSVGVSGSPNSIILGSSAGPGLSTSGSQILIGHAATGPIGNIMVIGSSTFSRMDSIYLGSGYEMAGAANSCTLSATRSSSGNGNGGDLRLIGGVPNGSGSNGNIILSHDGSAVRGQVAIGHTTPDELLHVAKAVDDGAAVCLQIENSQANAAASTAETTDIMFGFGGVNNAGRIRMGKTADFSSNGNRSSFMSFWTDNANTLTEAIRLEANGNLNMQNHSITNLAGTKMVYEVVSVPNNGTAVAFTNFTANIGALSVNAKATGNGTTGSNAVATFNVSKRAGASGSILRNTSATGSVSSEEINLTWADAAGLKILFTASVNGGVGNTAVNVLIMYPE